MNSSEQVLLHLSGDEREIILYHIRTECPPGWKP